MVVAADERQRQTRGNGRQISAVAMIRQNASVAASEKCDGERERAMAEEVIALQEIGDDGGCG